MAADHHSVYVAISGLSAEPANSTGSLVAIDMKTGAKRWQTAASAVACSWSGAVTCSHGQAQAVTVIPVPRSPDRWTATCAPIPPSTARFCGLRHRPDFATVNRVKAGGGSLDQGGATIVNGVVYVNSGSERGNPGNVLLAFSVDGK